MIVTRSVSEEAIYENLAKSLAYASGYDITQVFQIGQLRFDELRNFKTCVSGFQTASYRTPRSVRSMNA
jgi:hypothetical protein